VNGIKNGKGTWRKGMADSANEYEGEFKNGAKHGFGVFKMGKTGDVYEGQFFLRISRHGHG
jgi:hypothetical protein